MLEQDIPQTHAGGFGQGNGTYFSVLITRSFLLSTAPWELWEGDTVSKEEMRVKFPWEAGAG